MSDWVYDAETRKLKLKRGEFAGTEKDAERSQEVANKLSSAEDEIKDLYWGMTFINKRLLALEEANYTLREKVYELEKQNKELAAQNKEFEKRLAKLEKATAKK